jgi:hypothetical protein
VGVTCVSNTSYSALHCLAVSLAEAAYLSTRLQTADYPNLIEGSGEMQTVATGMVLSAAKDKDDPGAAARIARFVDTLFPRFAELQASDRHPKWREVNLTATLPGLSRTPEAGSWLAQRSAMTAKPIAAIAGVVAKAAVPQNLVIASIRRRRCSRNSSNGSAAGRTNAHLFAAREQKEGSVSSCELGAFGGTSAPYGGMGECTGTTGIRVGE